MIRHIVMWNFKQGLSETQKSENAQEMKKQLEALKEKTSGVIEIDVVISPLATGNADIMLTSLFENEQALADYQVHPEHLRVGQFISSFLCNRMCIDYVE